MKILKSNLYIGPNQYAKFRVIRHILDIGVLEDWPSAKLGSGFIDALIAALPGLDEHGCSYREPGGFVRRLREDDGTWMAHITEHVALELQCVAGNEVSFGRTRSTGEVGQYNMVYAYIHRDVGLAAGELAIKLLMHLLPAEVQAQTGYALDEDWDWDDELRSFIKHAQRHAFGPSTASLVAAAEQRGVPWLRLNKYSLVQFGHGKHQQRIQATITSETKHIAVEISCDKEDTHNLLNDLGLPVPHQFMIYSPREAVRAAHRIGYPVVLKPLNANHGRGVSINLTTDDEVRTAFDFARDQGTSKAVLVESYITGFDHRMLVVGNELVAVAKRVPGHVTGDGKKSISDLIDQVNEDPRRGVGHEKVLTKLELDNQARRLMDNAGYDEQTVLNEGEIFYLRDTANLSTGGTAIDLTDVVHPDNREMAVRAIMAVGLDVGGVDFLTDDISQSYKDIGGAIVEVNAAPGFRMHVAPSEGLPRDVAGKVLDMLFPAGTASRIPIAAITGTNGKTTTSRMLAHILKTCGNTVGLTTTDGIYVDGKQTVKGDTTGPKSAQMVLRDPAVDFAVLETARGGLVRSGLGYDSTNVSACLNVSSDHLGLGGVDTIEDLAKIKRIVVEAATDTVVLNADDKNCLLMADYCDADHIFYVTMHHDHALVKQHIDAGGKAAVLERAMNGDMITIYDNCTHISLIWTHLIPATIEGKAMHNVQNAMFAAAMAYSFGQDIDQIRLGLKTFNTTFSQAPGRMNVFDELPFRVILDYAHNPAAFETLTNLVDKLDNHNRKIIAVSSPGDRRDEDIMESTRILAGHYDHYVLKADDNRRGRGDDEIPQLMKQGLIDNGVAEDAITIIPDEQEAIEQALKMGGEKDLLIVIGDNVARSWKQIVHFGDSLPEVAADPDAEPAIPMDYGELVDEDQSLISDDRGVRLARSEDEDGD
ncbi:cyanophycin synthetase [Parasphingorhabdus sp.]|uniref:cyanophycin synthetase n=1 Tax=Parasphingorhabdus sp. TaxID=2709688 RepID=UPI0007F342AD|nr:cyanophycin synthetase [Sphingomonadales bacterium EhC05]